MDLKTYAVHRKLGYDDELLRYVMDDKPVPLPVIEASFQEYLNSQNDEKASRLLTDYTKLLGEDVPVVISRNENGGYEVSGDIPDTLVEALELVHKLKPDDVVKALVDYNMTMVHGKTCEVVSTTLGEQAKRTLMQVAAIPSVVPVAEIKEPEDFLEADRPAFTEDLDDAFPDTESDTEATDNPDTAEDVSFMDAETFATPQEEQDEEDVASLDMSDEVPDEVMEEPMDMEEDTQADDFAAKVQRIYDRFCADLRAYGLDSRLNLSM